ncbi:MAG TPA: ArsB/NhaD family transporter, partial [Chloroflexota bacterium]|nr:ArsB/NhaD family transporter [Chloroflexota bacterium]
LLPVSNLTNLLVYGLLNLPFWSFVRLLFWPELAAVVVNVLVFLALFRRMIPSRFAASEEWHASTGDPVGLVIAGGELVGVVAALMIFGLLGLPLYIPAAAGAVIMGLVALRRRDIELSDLRHGVAWSLPLFVVGMYTVVLAATRSGLDLLVGRPLLHLLDGPLSPAGLLLLSFAAALGSNLLNNIPMALVVITSLMTAPAQHREIAALAALIGTNVGANGTTFGSLATLLVLRAARRAGFQIDLREFLRISVLTTPLMVCAAALSLWLALQ